MPTQKETHRYCQWGEGRGKGKIADGEYKGQATMYKIDKLEGYIVLAIIR